MSPFARPFFVVAWTAFRTMSYDGDEKRLSADLDVEKQALPYKEQVAAVAGLDEEDPNFDPDAVQVGL